MRQIHFNFTATMEVKLQHELRELRDLSGSMEVDPVVWNSWLLREIAVLRRQVQELQGRLERFEGGECLSKMKSPAAKPAARNSTSMKPKG